MATTDKAPITLSSDRLDMDLFRLLLTSKSRESKNMIGWIWTYLDCYLQGM